MAIFFVKNEAGCGVGFRSEVDAHYASTGVAESIYVNELAVHFRRIFGAKKGMVYPIEKLFVAETENSHNLNNKSY